MSFIIQNSLKNNLGIENRVKWTNEQKDKKDRYTIYTKAPICSTIAEQIWYLRAPNS